MQIKLGRLGVVAGLAFGAVAGDNFHSDKQAKVFCNGKDLGVACSGSRWKISFLGMDDYIHIEEKTEGVFITGIKQMDHLVERETADTVYFPKKYPIVLHNDPVFVIYLPKKVAVMTGSIFLSLGLSFLGFKIVSGLFK
ncbi:hypothetical protein NEDG_01537 [Nematocida displodere]|uniref:Uncharacterized protein n=1 Tax=Nematocida displodere TaxID=1805483 RepID=A0A177EF07_9MICR|nr:hypothetical protein NEDG_01537 [Nematocida displodere]